MFRLLGILLVGSMALIFSVHQSWAAIKIRNSSLDNLNKAIVLLLKRDDSAACRIVDQYIETQDISVSNYEWNKLSIICSAVSGNISKATAQTDLIKFFLPGDVFIDLAEGNYRPIAIRAVDDGMPDNFTLITASSGNEFSGPLEEAKHGLFSYFLMKGMEGEVDQNSDNKITAGELHSYVQQNVVQQSSGSQTPELQGDPEHVLVRFQEL